MASVAQGELVADFDGDGKNDLLVYGTVNASTSTQVQAFLSSRAGQGNFGPVAPQTLAAPLLTYLTPAVLDVDGDGKLDLLIGNMVAYGNGDGTFSRVAVLPVLASGFNQTYAVDVNGDGKLDIVAVDAPPPVNSPGKVQYAFTVFRNNGSGRFTAMGPYPLAPSFAAGSGAIYNIFGLSFADINGDGKVDVLSQSNVVAFGNGASANKLNVVLNNGDGTFGLPEPVDNSLTASLGYNGTEFADLDGDGKQDLVLAYSHNSGGNYVGAALGNGDGTFGAIHELLLDSALAPSISKPFVELLDFNFDGKIDAVLGSGELALGSGNGTFVLSTPLFAQPANPQTTLNYPLQQMPIYPHSSSSLVYVNLTGGADAVFTPEDSSSANVSIALSGGTHTLTAQYSGDSTYTAGTSLPVTITVGPASTTTTVTSSANPSYTGESVTFTATVAGLTPGGGGTVTFSNGSTTLGTAPVNNGAASYAATLSDAGTETITAAYSGDTNNAASSSTVTQTVNAPLTVGAGTGGSTALTVASGQSVTAPVDVTGNAGFSGTVNFSCTGLPAHATCSFSPASVAISGTAKGSTTLTISTAASTPANARDGEPLPAKVVFACGLPLLGLMMLLPVTRGRRLLFCAGFLLFATATGLTGCGGGSSGGDQTAPGSYTFQVVATSGSASSAASYTLSVH